MNAPTFVGWDRLRHGGLLLDTPRLQGVALLAPPALARYHEEEFRRQAAALLVDGADASAFVAFVLERVCGFAPGTGSWQRGPALGTEWSRRTPTGETAKPRHLWRGPHDAILPVFLDNEKRVGIGLSRRTASQVVQWLRAGNERLALLTNGRQWRLVFAGLDFDAFCEWDAELWFEEGELSPQVHALRTLLSPRAFTPNSQGQPAPLLAAVLDSRKGQAELSSALGERVREAVELLVQAHGEALRAHCADVDPAETYRAAVRVVMRLVVVLFAESRDLLPRDNALYHGAYGIGGLLEELEKSSARSSSRLARSHSAWPRLLALFRLVHQGSHHPALPVPAYGGELFAPATERDGLSRALRIFETAVFDSRQAIFSDREVYRLLEKVSRTRMCLRQGRQNSWVTVPVDFSDLSSEYIGILYEGLLDFELKTAPAGDPVIFLAVGNQPALPLSRLEGMDDKTLAALLEKMKDTSRQGESEEDEEGDEVKDTDEPADDSEADAAEPDDDSAAEPGDDRHTTRTRAEAWARRAVEAGKLVAKPSGTPTPDKRRLYEEAVTRKSRQLVIRVVLPGEWYLVRWGGTRKGSGTFYTRPGLAVPTVQRTLRPLAYTPPVRTDGTPDSDAPACDWLPRRPEEILALKTCDPACGSGTFPVASLRYLTDALYAAVHHHGRLTDSGDRSVVSLLGQQATGADDVAELGQELVPCRPEDPSFERRLKALLKRHVVERCIYGVDLDPLAVELCRLSLWIETMDRTLPFSFLDHKIKCGNGLVGAWFDQFLHYPVMAWKNREGGDKGHANGVHFPKESRGKALRDFATGTLQSDLAHFLTGPTLFDPNDRLREASAVHADALALLARLHDLPVQDAAERSRIYRDDLLAAPAWQRLKAAMDLWCACWFWPAEALAHAPLPSTLATPSPETQAEAARLAARLRFFHWELEFPDVFCAAGSGFDAILGNPPWENLQPNPEEFFSNYDPLFRTYGRLAKNERLKDLFGADIETEKAWLNYSADFNSMSNWVTYAGKCFGDPNTSETNNDRFSIARGKSNDGLHARWRTLRQQSTGYADVAHPFLHQTGRIFTYRLFLEQSHALLRVGGRMGQIVPSGIYSDAWSQPLRTLFLDRCRWEWLFGFENRDGVFEIDSRFKFNPIIVQKGGATASIHTAFMRRKLEDWERAEELATPYTRAQVDQFSPRSQAILEIQSQRDLEILEKIYANSVLLGDDGPEGWGIKYKLEFMMNTDAHLFPPRTRWEEQGYRPDEYSRWLKGDWRPIAELWAELGIDPTHVTPPGVLLEDWLFDTSASPDRRAAEARFVHGHLLKPGDVARTSPRLRCAQPPYDTLPIPRAELPAGVILAREADAWVREERVEDVALPFMQGAMLHQFDFSQKGWISGTGLQAKWKPIDWSNKYIDPQFLMATVHATGIGLRTLHRRVARNTDARTMIASLSWSSPAGDKAPVLSTRSSVGDAALVAILNSFVFDRLLRDRCGSTNIDLTSLEAMPLPSRQSQALEQLLPSIVALNGPSPIAVSSRLFVLAKLHSVSQDAPRLQTIGVADRLRARVVIDAIIVRLFNLNHKAVAHLLNNCDLATDDLAQRNIRAGLDPKGFWRVDKEKDPELRHTVLTLIAFHDLEAKIREHGGDRDAGIAAFLAQNHGEGWLLPETLRLADYGLGHDERAQHHQPVASRLGPRFYDWQLTQSAEESWRECHLHARNLLGETGYRNLLADIEAERSGTRPTPSAPPPTASKGDDTQQMNLFN